MKNKTAKAWLWEFSKRVVAVLLALYIIHSLSAYAVMIYSGDFSALSTVLTESNETFRVCIGGYLLKATIENRIKLSRSSK